MFTSIAIILLSDNNKCGHDVEQFESSYIDENVQRSSHFDKLVVPQNV